MTQVCDVGNKGDQGILKSEIALLRKLFPHCEISVATWWSNDLLKEVEPEIEVYSPLVDFKIRGKEVPLTLYLPVLVVTFFLSVLSALLVRFSFTPLYRGGHLCALKNADLVISSGHQPFFECSRYRQRTLWDTLANFLVMFWGATDVLVARKIFRRRFATFPQSVGPFNTFVGRFFARFIFGNMDAVCVRENISKHTLEQLGVLTPIFSLVDMGFFFEANLVVQKADFTVPVIGVSPCFIAAMGDEEKARYVLVISEVMKKMQEQYGTSVVLLPSQTTQGKAMVVSGRESDCAVCELIQTNVCGQRLGQQTVTTTFCTQFIDEFVNILRQLDMLITTRMHPSIFAAGLSVPFVEIIYEHKQVGLLKSLQLSEVGLSVNDLSIEKLLAKANYVWENRGAIQKHLKEQVALLRSRDRPILERLLTLLVTSN
ncbi:MAG: polysaccharide pyruvyl transferase family protein [Candidatus Bathyarchaeota archaeon]|nr:polysaccharide pyruvyl transferase family protein [Candidatus Bathyarchaeota archaeon]